ncbi:MAG: hypothetical protein R2876_01280 [Eubacteriales bacterium]
MDLKGLNVIVKALFFVRLKWTVRLEKEDVIFKLNLYTKKKKRTILTLKKLIENIKNIKNEKITVRNARNQLIKDIFSHAHFYIKSLKIVYGDDDAAKTVNVISFIRILLNVLIGVFSTYTSIEIHNCRFLPQFQKKYLDMDFNCIIKLKAAHITIAYIKYLIKRR